MTHNTAILQITAGGAQVGRFLIVGAVPPSCYNATHQRSNVYQSEDAALKAILADEWIKANPRHTIQLADGSPL